MKLVLSSTIISSLAALPATVYGHGYLETPMARNLYAHREGRSGNPSNAPAIPLYQTTPQGLNRNKNVCGMDQGYPDNDYDSWLDTQGNPMPWISQAIYNPGDIIEVNSFLTAHHKGYLEVKGCPRGRDSTQECFDSYPLEFVKDLLYDMPQDTAYPNRGYLHGVEPRLSMQFKLPEGLVGEQVLLQWVYWTANSCNPIGFAEYYSTPKPVGPTGPNWNSLLSTCPPESETPIAPIPNPNSSVLAPERFINCAEVTVTGVQTPAPPFPSPIPPPTSAPVENPVTSPPVSQPPINPGIVGTCGGGNTGNGICPDHSMCCSKWGHCGYESTGHCDQLAPNDAPSNPIPPPVSSPVAPPTSAPVENPVTSPPVSQPPINPEIVGTCGGGNTGNGICPVHSMCCSKWGYCGYESTGHCDDPAPIDAPSNPIPMPVSPPVSMPVDAPTLPLPPTHDHHDDNSRLIAYLGNWQSCPSDEQVARYTHIVIAFAVSYTWSPGKNVCSETCEIMVPPVCGDAARPDLIQKWKNMGKKVILSFGGAGMGGSWVGDNNDCWDYCFGRETQVVDRLTDIVNEMGLDGIDIDYEYFYEDHQNGSGFTKGAEAQNFLSQVTIGLRDSMPAGFELTHAPMEPDMVPGKGYFEVLKEVASSLDFLMPQYYNGYVQSHSNFDGALDHYTTLANQMFNGDASKIVYGFCINDCGSFNLDGYESAEVMEWLSKEYPCNGGAFFWVANDDRNSEWSIPVRDQLLIDSEQC